MKTLSIGEKISLNHFLSQYPNFAFNEILNLIHVNSHEVLKWFPFEEFGSDLLIDNILHLAETIDTAITLQKSK